VKRLIDMLRATVKDWLEDKAPRLAAALSYYTVFSLPPLLVLLIGIAGLAFGANEVRERLVSEIGGLVGEESAALLGEAIVEAEGSTGTGAAIVIGVAVLIFGASGVFAQLQEALNTIWEVKPGNGKGIFKAIQSRLLSFAAVVGSGFLLLVSLAISAAIGAMVERISRVERLAPFLSALDITLSLVVVTAIFAFIFKFLPDVKVRWGDVWMGAAVTAVLFVIGKFAIGFYLGTSDVGSAYGAAGSLIIVLVWIYYSALILFFGAEFTQVWSTRRSKAVRPAPPAAATNARSPGETTLRREPPAWVVLAAFFFGWLAARRGRH
jgi:membrane protein